MNRLSLVDDTFLRLESRRQPLHIGMLMLFEPPPGGSADFSARLADRLRESNKAAEPFNRRLERHRGMHYWAEDDEFDLAHHFVHTSLPKPGRVRELLAMVSRIHCGHLDRAYPLWRIYLIEGIEDGRVAVYLKIHHSMVDGVVGIRMLVESMATTPEESLKLPPPWEVERTRPKTQAFPVPTPGAGGIAALRSLGREGMKSIAPLLRELRSTFRDYRAGNPDLSIAGQAPRTILNDKVSGTRRFAAQSYSTPRMRAVAKACDASLNDVVLAMCGSALRRYLQDLGQLPKESLVAAVPVSTRQDPLEGFGNEVAFTMTHLATDTDDPLERLARIRSCMVYNKARMQKLSAGQLMAYAALTLLPGAFGTQLGVLRNRTLGSLCISHVPGPRQDLYWQGARLTGLYPASLLIDGSTLNITIVSRHDFVDFGLIACRKSLPHMQRLLDYIEDGLKELEIAAGTASPVAGEKPAEAPGPTAKKKTSAIRKKQN